VKLWFDEDLSPTLVQVAHALGLEATCKRDRDALAAKDPQLRRLEQGFVFVTDNAADFRPMYERDAVHPGLIVIGRCLTTGGHATARATGTRSGQRSAGRRLPFHAWTP
jgi:hypothetical protein